MSRVGRTTFPLLADGTLSVEAEPAALVPLRRWLPLLPYPDRQPAPNAMRLRVRASAPHVPAPRRPAALRLGTASAWLAGDRVRLRGDAGASGRLHLGRGIGVLGAPDGNGAAAGEVYFLATLATALLLGRAGRPLVHAAAPVDPGGRAWLLVGDTHAGKTTTCANLIAAGWSFTSDDHVVLGPGPVVEGLPRPFHLDAGWGSAAPVGRRGETDPTVAWPGRWVERGPLAGVLLPRVAPESPTRAERVPAAQALTMLIRQSPWLVADRAAAPALLALLGEAAQVPAYTLSLGLDTFGDPERLAAIMTRLP